MDRRRMFGNRGTRFGSVRWIPLLVSLATAVATAGAAPDAAAKPGPAQAPRDSIQQLPFLPADEPGQSFTASRLTKVYARDVMQFVRPVRRSRPTELEGLDQLAAAPAAVADTAAADSSDIRLTRARQGKGSAELAPGEKAALVPEKPGAHVGIPSPVAATTALLGGFVLLLKLISELAR
jgi:hypothetical protein